MRPDRAVYPFCAVVGRERAKKALLLHAVNPLLKGVLLCGAPGTGKTTLMQSVAELLPERKPVVIPLNVDESRLLGGWDAAEALRSGERAYTAGLLTAADGRMVLVDNAGLMPERLLKTILDAADRGYCESEGAEGPVCRPSRFLLFGACIPEQGKPLSATADRWGLYVQMETSADRAERAEIMRRLLDFERDPDAFRRKFEQETEQVRSRIADTRRRLSSVLVREPMLRLAAEIAREAGCPGHRADILLLETARTIAAWEGQAEIDADHLREAAGFVLPHRMMAARDPREVASGAASTKEVERSEPDRARQENGDNRESGGPTDEKETPPRSAHAGDNHPDDRIDESGHGGSPDGEAGAIEARAITEAVGREIDIRPLMFDPPRAMRKTKAGKRNQGGKGSSAGRYVRAAIPRGPVRDLAFDATIRTAAPYQRWRREHRSANDRWLAVWIEPGDLRVKVRESKTGTAMLFVVDASGSMNADKRMKAVKGAILSLLRNAYRQRDSVGLIAFRDKGAELMLQMTRSVELAERMLRKMPVGGGTPLSAGLSKGWETIRSVLRKGSGLVPAMIVVTDGKANVVAGVGPDPWQESLIIARRIADAGVRTLVIDTESGFVRLGYARKLANELQAQYYRLEQLEADSIERAVRTLV
jgi:magnesium chelatase subunit D